MAQLEKYKLEPRHTGPRIDFVISGPPYTALNYSNKEIRLVKNPRWTN